MPCIDFTREFDAPVTAVFEAHRDPELVKQWLGPRRLRDGHRGVRLRAAAADTATSTAPRGDEFRFNGMFHTVRDGDFAIQTFEFEGCPTTSPSSSIAFEDLGDGRTRLRGP